MIELRLNTRWIGLTAVTALALYLCWLMLQQFLNVLAWATVLVILFYPIHKRISTRIKSRSLSAAISTVMVILLVVLPATFAAMALVHELTDIAQNVQSNSHSLFNSDSPAVARMLSRARQYFDAQNLDQLVADKLKNVSGDIAKQIVGLIGGLIRTIVTAFFIVFTMYYLFRDSEKILRVAPTLLPMSKKQSERVIKRAKEVMSASVYGVVCIGLIQGSVGGLAFWFLGLPSPALWTCVMIILSMIPMTGAPFVWVPAAIALAATGQWGKAIVLVAWGIFIINPIDNFLRPKLVTNRARLHELFVFFSVIGGLKVFGILGMVLGPLILALTISLWDLFRHSNSYMVGIRLEKTKSVQGSQSAVIV